MRTNMSVITPRSNISQHSHVKSVGEYELMHQAALEDPAKFWLEYAKKFYWKKKPTYKEALSYNFDIFKGPIFVKWFADGVTNICYNALDVHIDQGLGDTVAFYWEGNDSNDVIKFTYQQLFKEVTRFGNALRSLGVGKGDCVAIYMPCILELVVAMLSCARLGAIHSVVFGGFSAEALADRILDAKCKLLITSDGTWRGSKLIDLKSNASDALRICATKGHHLETCIVVQHVTAEPSYRRSATNNCDRTEGDLGTRPTKRLHVDMTPGRDIWWHELMSRQADNAVCPVEWMNAEDTLFILYTSGSTGKPKGVVHTVAGYMLYTACTFFYVFDFCRNEDVFWCTADPGWITGHSYVVYGPLLNGSTNVIFEGIPTWPDAGRCWAIVDRYQVTKFYTAPTAIRTLMGAGDDFVTRYRRTSLKVLGTVGEPINPRAWDWYYDVVGNSSCSIVDTYWQTETGGHIITPLPGAHIMKPGSASRPFFGIDVRIMSESGEDLTPTTNLSKASKVKGHLVVRRPWPGMLRTLFGSHERFQTVYFRKFPGHFLTGDGATIDEDGDIWITGRIDDMLNMSGHLISTSEVESALLTHSAVTEAAVVSREHEIKGQCLHCFVTLKASADGHTDDFGLTAEFRRELAQILRTRIGPFVQLDHIQEAPVLPKTRSGKIVRRILRQIANGNNTFGDTTTLADPSCLSTLINRAQLA